MKKHHHYFKINIKDFSFRIMMAAFVFLVFLNQPVFAQKNTSYKFSTEGELRKYVSAILLNTKKSHFVLASDYSYKTLYEYWLEDNKKNSELNEIYFPSLYGKRGSKGVSILIEKNNVPLTQDEINRNRAKALEKLLENNTETRENPNALENLRNDGISLEWMHFNVSVGLWAFLGNCQFKVKEQSIIDKREILILTFDQCSVLNLPKQMGYMKKLRGEILSDIKTQSVYSLKAYSETVNQLTSDPANKAEASPVIIFQQTFVDEQVWLPKLIQVNTIKTKDIFSTSKINWRIQFYDYKLNKVDVKFYNN